MVGQTLPHAPQFEVSVAVETQLPEQFVVPLGQLTVHAPFEQLRPVPQGLSQAPQFAASVLVSTQAPEQSV
jgi:hypothetical protein